MLQLMLPGALLTKATPAFHWGEGSSVSIWDPHGNAVSQQHFLSTSPMGKHWDCAQPRLVCTGAGGCCWEGVGIAQHLWSRSLSQVRQVGLEGDFSLWKKMGWRTAGEDHGRRASHRGEGKEQLSPSVTLCFMAPVVASSAKRDSQPWGQRGTRGPCWHHSPPRPRPGPVL